MIWRNAPAIQSHDQLGCRRRKHSMSPSLGQLGRIVGRTRLDITTIIDPAADVRNWAASCMSALRGYIAMGGNALTQRYFLDVRGHIIAFFSAQLSSAVSTSQRMLTFSREHSQIILDLISLCARQTGIYRESAQDYLSRTCGTFHIAQIS